MPKYQATAYIRLSYTDDRSSESDSVTNQRKLIENFIERNPDIQIVSEKIDDGYSGIIFDRPAFKEMMQDITDGKINCVIVKDLSRLGREYIETGRYLRRVFPTYGVRFIAITDNIDTAHEGSGDDLTVSVKNIMNEAYCRDISIKTRTSLDIKRRNGDFVGAFPVYGYMKSEENKNLLVPDPYASRVVQDIFRMRLDGTSALRIATVLNEMGILSPLAYKKNNGFPYAKHGYADKEDCKWSATTIIRILQDETYIGTLVQGKQGTPHYKIKQMEQRPSSEWIRVPDAHEPLIAKQDFELVQRPQTGYPDFSQAGYGVSVFRCLNLRVLWEPHDAENEPGQGQGISLLLLPHREKAWLHQPGNAQGKRSCRVRQGQSERLH